MILDWTRAFRSTALPCLRASAGMTTAPSSRYHEARSVIIETIAEMSRVASLSWGWPEVSGMLGLQYTEQDVWSKWFTFATERMPKPDISHSMTPLSLTTNEASTRSSLSHKQFNEFKGCPLTFLRSLPKLLQETGCGKERGWTMLEDVCCRVHDTDTTRTIVGQAFTETTATWIADTWKCAVWGAFESNLTGDGIYINKMYQKVKKQYKKIVKNITKN